MKNVQIKKDGKKLTLTIDTSKDFGRSKSGKTVVIATTQGNVDVGDGVFVGLNVYRYPDSK